MIAFDEQIDLDHEGLATDTLWLTSDQMASAVALSQAEPHPERQWRIYLHGLALQGFTQWLQDRDPDLSLRTEQVSLRDPAYAHAIDAVCGLQVGELRLCLLTSGTLVDSLVSLPKAAVDLPDWAAQLFVWIEVDEHQGAVRVAGVLRRDQLLRRLDRLGQPSEWEYDIPLSWFELDNNQLLLYLRCLQATALPMTTAAVELTANHQARLQQLLPQLQQADVLPEVRLPWSLGAALLSHPQWTHWLYQVQRGQSPAWPQPPRSQAWPQGVINTGLWLRQQLDPLAQSLAWTLLPPPQLASAMRTTTLEDFGPLLQSLDDRGLSLGVGAAAAYHDVSWAGGGLRLYALSWALPGTTGDPEWTLLVIVGPQPGQPRPQGGGLQISDDESRLVERYFGDDGDDEYLYAQVIGSWQEAFQVSLQFPDGTTLTLPPLGFQPDLL